MEAGLGAALTASCPCPPAPSWWSSSPACPTRPSGRWCCARPASSAPAPACWSACTTATTAWRPRSTSIGGRPPSWGGSRVARGGVPSAPCPAGWAGVPTPLILRCLLQGPSEDARVRAERQLWWAGPVPTQGSQLPRGSRRPPPPMASFPPYPQVSQVQHPDFEQQNPPGWGQPPGGADLRLPVPGTGPPTWVPVGLGSGRGPRPQPLPQALH